jgi:hypothetical protein
MPSMTSQSLAYWKYKPLYLKDTTLKSKKYFTIQLFLSCRINTENIESGLIGTLTNTKISYELNKKALIFIGI